MLMLRKVRRNVILALVSVAVFIFMGEGIALGDWKQDWDKTLKAAKKEGKLVLYGGYNPRYRKLNKAFEKKYGIKVNFTPGGGSQHATRILSERRVNKFLVDVVMGGGGTFLTYPKGAFDPMRELIILPEVVDASAWWGGKLHFFDVDEKYVVTTMAYVGSARIAINTKLVNPGDLRSWNDLLNPRWKGKILHFHRGDPAVSPTVMFMYYTPGFGPKFLSRFYREMDVTFTRNLRQGINWLAQGKYSLYFGGTPNSIYRANKKGLAVNFLPHGLKEGEILSGGYCCLAALNRAPNPNAAKVFVNWILSRDGQTAWQKLPGSPTASLRTDIAKDYLPQNIVPKKGGKYFHVHEANHYNPKNLKAIRKIIKDAAKKK